MAKSSVSARKAQLEQARKRIQIRAKVISLQDGIARSRESISVLRQKLKRM